MNDGKFGGQTQTPDEPEPIRSHHMSDTPNLVSLSAAAKSRSSIAVPYTEMEVNTILYSIGDVLQPALLDLEEEEESEISARDLLQAAQFDIEEESFVSGEGPEASV
jgi:hypothetical protein